jgi:hypothetical protein
LLIAGIFLGLFTFSHSEVNAQLNNEDQKCVDAINKGAGKVAKAQGGDNVACIKNGGQGKLTTSVEDCLTADGKGKVGKAISKLQTEKCLAPPAFPNLVSTTDKQAIGDVMIGKELDLVHSLFGSDLDESVVLWADNKEGGKCQAAVAKAAQKCQDTKLKVFRSCKKNALKEGAASAAELQDACLGTGASGMPDPKGKITKKCGGDFDIAKKCSGQDLDAMIPGCAGAPDHAACIDQKIECEVCLALNTLDGLDRSCDEFDDGVIDGSCGVVCGNGVIDFGEECEIDSDCLAGYSCNSSCACEATLPGPGDLVITEIMRNPSAVSDSSGEWFEIQNVSATTLNLQGLVIQDDDFDSFTVSGSTVVPAGGHLVFGNNADPNTNGAVNVDVVWSSFILANTTDEIDVFSEAVRIDRVAYDNISFPSTPGAAMSLDPNFTNTSDNDIGTNWCDAATPLSGGDFGSPGAENPACVAPLPGPGDLVITEIMNNPSAVSDSAGEWFEIQNVSGTPLTLEGLVIQDDGSDSFTVSGASVVSAWDYFVLGNNADPNTNGGLNVPPGRCRNEPRPGLHKYLRKRHRQQLV